MRDEIYYFELIGWGDLLEEKMVYPDFTLSYGTTSVTLNNQNIVSWSRAMIEPDSNDMYKGIQVRIQGETLHRWSLSLIAKSEDTGFIKQIYREATRDRFNKELPGAFDVTLTDNAELSTESAIHKVLIATCTPKPISCDRYEIELELIENPEFTYIPSFSIGGTSFNQSEISSYSSQAVIEEDKADSWEWTLDLILDSPKMSSLYNTWTSYSTAKRAYELSQNGEGGVAASKPMVQISDQTGAGPSSAGCQIVSFSHKPSFRGYEVSISLKRADTEESTDADNLTFSVAGTLFRGKEIKSAKIAPLITMGIEIIPTGTTVVTDNCGGGVWTWNCSFESTKEKCNAVVEASREQRMVLSTATSGGAWLVPVIDGVNGKSGMCAIESADADFIEDKPGKWTLSCSLREVNT